MNSVRARVAYVVTLSLVTLALSAAPAAAAPAISGSAVLADEQFKWFYWIGFFLAAGVIGLLISLLVGYYMRVLRPKWRGREVK